MALQDEVRDAFRRGDNERTRELAEELHRSGDEVEALCWLARVALREGEPERVKELAAEARRLAADEHAEQMPLHLQAAGARVAGELDDARRLYLESIDLNRRLGEAFVAAELHNLGFVELHAGKLPRAKELFEEALAEARANSFDLLLPYIVLDRGVVAVEEGELETGVKLLACGRAVFEARGELIDPDDAAEVERSVDKARDGLAPDAFARAEAEGRAMSIDDALA